MPRLLLALALLLPAACGGPEDCPTALVLDLRVHVDLVPLATPDAATARFSVNLQQWFSRGDTCDLVSANGVAAQAGAVGMPLVDLTDEGMGFYTGEQIGYAAAYELDAGGASLRLTSPQFFTAELADSILDAGGTSAVTWMPSGEPGVDAFVRVTDEAMQITYESELDDPADDGQEALPAPAFSRRGTHTVAVDRQRFAVEDDGMRQGDVTLSWTDLVDVR